MAAVDPNDDSIQRWVVWHYRYDSDRRERRNVVVAAFDDIDEFHADIEQRAGELRDRRERGETVDAAEHISGTLYEAGYQRLRRNAQLVKRAIEHGVTPAGIEDLELPSGVGFVQARRLE